MPRGSASITAMACPSGLVAEKKTQLRPSDEFRPAGPCAGGAAPWSMAMRLTALQAFVHAQSSCVSPACGNFQCRMPDRFFSARLKAMVRKSSAGVVLQVAREPRNRARLRGSREPRKRGRRAGRPPLAGRGLKCFLGNSPRQITHKPWGSLRAMTTGFGTRIVRIRT